MPARLGEGQGLAVGLLGLVVLAARGEDVSEEPEGVGLIASLVGRARELQRALNRPQRVVQSPGARVSLSKVQCVAASRKRIAGYPREHHASKATSAWTFRPACARIPVAPGDIVPQRRIGFRKAPDLIL